MLLLSSEIELKKSVSNFAYSELINLDLNDFHKIDVTPKSNIESVGFNKSSSRDNIVAINDFSSFETGNDGWNRNIDIGDDFNWTRRQTNTPSEGTGPQNGGGSSGSWFMFIETSDPIISGQRAFMDKSFNFSDQVNAQL